MLPSTAEIRKSSSAGGIVRKIRDVSFIIVAILVESLAEALFPTGVKRVRHCTKGFRWEIGGRCGCFKILLMIFVSACGTEILRWREEHTLCNNDSV